ncbi:MAG TPA: cation-translocating P-type ATPase [Myxococcota bacterium]|nr:cation-translocating P-type ATPase [Myxococcota bacterium]
MSATLAEVGFALGGLRCAGCAARVERELRCAPGVREASVSFATQRALVCFDPSATDAAALAARVEALGYRAARFDPEALERPGDRDARAALARVLVAAFLAGNLMVISFALYFGALQDIDPALRRALRWLALALSLPSLAYCALPFWRGALAGLRRRELTLDVPIVLGATTAFAAGVVGTLGEARDLFTDSAATIIFLMLLGRALERGARTRASSAVEALAARAPRSALRRAGERLEPVAADRLAPGDRVVVARGQAFPVDGRLLSGPVEIDESLLSGESLPVTRAAGDEARGGTVCLSGDAEVEVTHGAATGTVARLVGLLERAQADRPRLQRAADRVAEVFAPAVLAIAALTALGCALAGVPPLETALRAASVLIVACPCALGLATPAAVSAALGRGAELGLWFRSGAALERAAAVDRVLLDKTGTLTTGQLSVARVIADAGHSENELVAAAAAAVGASAHPVSSAIRAEAARRGLGAAATCGERRELPGLGVEGGELRCGSAALLHMRGVEIGEGLAAAAKAEAERGASIAFVARDARALGALALADPLRADAAAAVARLRALGLSLALISGDQPAAVGCAARAAGIGEASSEVGPEGKLERVAGERARGVHVAFAGDGINDAAALAAADFGFAFAHGSDVTVFAADVVSHDAQLDSLPRALALARAAMRRIRENLALAIAYNAVAVPLAIAGILGPFSAALAMSASSLVVTGNALRLRRFGRRR